MKTLLTKDVRYILLSTLLFFASFNMILPTFPVFVASIGGTEQIVGLLGGLLALSAVVQRPYLASLTDLWGRKNVLLIAAFFTVTGPLLYLVSNAFWYLALARVYHAVGLAAFVTAGQTLLADLAPEGQRGSLMGLYGVASGIPMAISPTIGFALIQTGGYGLLFTTASLLGLGIIPICFLLHEPNRPSLQQRRTGRSVFWQLLHNPSVRTACTAVFIITMALGAVNVFVPLYALAMGLTNIGLFFTAFALTFMGGGALSGYLSDRHGYRVTILPAFLLMAMGTALLLYTASYALFVFAGLLIGLGFSSLITVLLSYTVARIEIEQRSRAISLYNNAFDLGISVGAMGLGLIAAQGFPLLWTTITGLLLGGFVLSLRYLQ